MLKVPRVVLLGGSLNKWYGPFLENKKLSGIPIVLAKNWKLDYPKLLSGGISSLSAFDIKNQKCSGDEDQDASSDDTDDDDGSDSDPSSEESSSEEDKKKKEKSGKKTDKKKKKKKTKQKKKKKKKKKKSKKSTEKKNKNGKKDKQDKKDKKDKEEAPKKKTIEDAWDKFGPSLRMEQVLFKFKKQVEDPDKKFKDILKNLQN